MKEKLKVIRQMRRRWRKGGEKEKEEKEEREEKEKEEEREDKEEERKRLLRFPVDLTGLRRDFVGSKRLFRLILQNSCSRCSSSSSSSCPPRSSDQLRSIFPKNSIDM